MSIHTALIQPVSVNGSGSNPLTLLQVVASNSKKLRVVRYGVSFQGSDVTQAPVKVELVRQTNQGTSTDLPIVQQDENGTAALATARSTFTQEPTAAAVLEAHFLTPAGGNLIEPFTYGTDDMPVVAPGGRLAIRVLAPATVSAVAFLVFEE